VQVADEADCPLPRLRNSGRVIDRATDTGRVMCAGPVTGRACKTRDALDDSVTSSTGTSPWLPLVASLGLRLDRAADYCRCSADTDLKPQRPNPKLTSM
jgi:hypothetical protein